MYDGRNRDLWLAEEILKDQDVVGFFTREHYYLDNFSSFAIIYNGVSYQTVEHAYQAQKFESPDIQRLIVNAMSAHDAKRIAHDHDDEKREDWEDIKVDIMEQLLRNKVAQYDYVRKKLLQTAGKKIVEDSPTDTFWGIGVDGNGQNKMGELWMKIRDELVAEESRILSKLCSKAFEAESISPSKGEKAWAEVYEYARKMDPNAKDELDDFKYAVKSYHDINLFIEFYMICGDVLSEEEYNYWRDFALKTYGPENEGLFPERKFK